MKVAIDPGHGMSNRQSGIYDPGATHVENDITYEEAGIAMHYGLKLKAVFLEEGCDVFMTRDDAEAHAPVGMRAARAKNAGCNVFISLHLNDFEADEANGLEVLYRDLDDEAFAHDLQDALLPITGFRDRGIKKREDLAVLKFQGPSALIELGFIANDGNRETLLDAQKRDEICKAIAAATVARFGQDSV